MSKMVPKESIIDTQNVSESAPHPQYEGSQMPAASSGIRGNSKNPRKSHRVKKNTKTPTKRARSGREKGRITGRSVTPVSSDKKGWEVLGGSPWDPTERRHLNFKDLDLHKSYVDDYKKAVSASQETDLPSTQSVHYVSCSPSILSTSSPSHPGDDLQKSPRLLRQSFDRPPQRRAVWNYKGKKPLTDISKLIEMGWDTREPDLDPT